MNKVQICDRIKDSLIKVFVADEAGAIISHGAGTVIHQRGLVLTANHVLCSRRGKPSGRIFGMPYRGGPVIPFQIAMSDFGFNMGGTDMVRELNIDLAILRGPQNRPWNPIPLEQNIPNEGSDVIMAGFPEDLKTPLDIVDNIKMPDHSTVRDLDHLREFSSSIIPWVMFKHGIIGSVFNIYVKHCEFEMFGSKLSFPLRGAEYWVDNASVRGASGGPVVTDEGTLIGIITETGETIASDATGTVSFPVPSGSTRVLSHRLLTWGIEKLNENL